MSQAATKIFLKHREDHRISSLTSDSFLPEQFGTTTTPDESMLTCMRDGPFTVISAAGMLNGGRILHHLKNRLPKGENTILFCGYQAEGTKGRFLQDNAQNLSTLRIHHEEVPLNAEIATLATLSAHGDWQDLLKWIAQMTKPPSKIFLNHGDPHAMLEFKTQIEKAYPKAKVIAALEPGRHALY
jgi:metallo-beta-lactamase family protein